MSEGRVRLKLAGETSDRAMPVREGDDRVALPSPSIAIVAALKAREADAFASELLAAAGEAKREARVWRAAMRDRAGVEASDDGVRASADAVAGAVDALIARMPRDGAITVAVGAPFVALARADVSVLLTSGAASVHWDASLRALRDRFALVIAEPRPRLARELVARLR